jgi:hypothetical protein
MKGRRFRGSIMRLMKGEGAAARYESDSTLDGVVASAFHRQPFDVKVNVMTIIEMGLFRFDAGRHLSCAKAPKNGDGN